MRVLCLASEYPPARGYGLGRYASEHCAALVRCGVEVHVACNNRDYETDVYRENGVLVHNAPLAIPFSGYAWVADVLQHNVSLLGRCLDMVRKNGGYDLLLTHDWLTASAAAALKSLYRTPLVAMMHDTEMGKSFGQLDQDQQYIAQMERWVCELADRVLANSGFIARELVEAYQVPGEKIAVVGCGVNSRTFETDADVGLFRTLFCRPEERLVGFVGRLARVKGPDILLQAVPAVLGICPDVRFVFAGEGAMGEGLHRQAQELGVADHVSFVGHLTGKVLATFYHACDLIAVPSVYEPFGMVALEAMACGTPVVASDTGGLQEIVLAGATGVSVPPRDPRSLASAIVQVLMNPQVAAAFAGQARQRVAAEFGWDDVAARTLQVCQTLCPSCSVGGQ